MQLAYILASKSAVFATCPLVVHSPIT